MFHRLLPRTLAACLRDLENPTAKVRRSAIADLARHVREQPDGAMIEALQKALRDDDAMVRMEAAYSLGDARRSEALPGLQMAIDDEHPRVRQAAIDSLGRIGDTRSTSRLLRALRDERPDVRFQAIIALGRVAPAEARDGAFELGRDKDPHVRYIAVRVIEELCGGGEQTDAAALVLDERTREAARAWVADEDPTVRVAAAILLARAEERTGADCLLEAIGNGIRGLDADDEAAAVELAGVLGLREAIPMLERRAFGIKRFVRECFTWLALVSLARLGHERARREIIRDLSAWSRDRRTMAVAAAGKARLIDAREIIEKMKGDDAKADPGAVDEALGQLQASQG